jgi:hypothetical protein
VVPQGIGYKAASYDRWANLSIRRRFTVTKIYERDPAPAATMVTLQHQAMDGDKQVFATAEVNVVRHDWDRRERIEEAQRKECATYLAERWPNWENPAAHWDDEG